MHILQTGLTLAFVIVASQANSADTIPAEVVAMANGYASSVRNKLDGQLVDYPGTRFKNVRATYSPRLPGKPDRLSFCGELNAKNRMGGYGGWTTFVYTPEDSGLLLIGGQDAMRGLPSAPIVARICDPAIVHWLPNDYTADFASKP
jgi:hypothetical protein